MEILLKILEHLPTSGMVVVNASSLSPVSMTGIPSKSQKIFQKIAGNLFYLKFFLSASWLPLSQPWATVEGAASLTQC